MTQLASRIRVNPKLDELYKAPDLAGMWSRLGHVITMDESRVGRSSFEMRQEIEGQAWDV
jgi:hypothetical protein